MEEKARGAALATRQLWSSGATRARRAAPARSEPRTGGSSTMAKSKKASARVTAASREQAMADFKARWLASYFCFAAFYCSVVALDKFHPAIACPAFRSLFQW